MAAEKVNTLRRHTGCCGAASGNGTRKRSDMWKSSGKSFTFLSQEAAQEVENIGGVGSMGD